MKNVVIKKCECLTFGQYIGKKYNKIYFIPDTLTMSDKECVISLFKRMTIRDRYTRDNTYIIITKDVEYHITKYNNTYVIRDFTKDIFYIYHI